MRRFIGAFAVFFCAQFGWFVQAEPYTLDDTPRAASAELSSVSLSGTEVYVGIVQFGAEAEEITGDTPILLNDGGFEQVIGILENRYKRTRKSGSALYYAVHKALASATAYENRYPANLENVYIITFTDGLDMSSTSFALKPLENQDFSNRPEKDYRNFLINQLRNRRIAGRSIIAYSVGIRSSDAANSELFKESLSTLAGSPANFYDMTQFDRLNALFDSIAKELTVNRQSTTFTLKTTSLSVGTKLRMTFDNLPPDFSECYLEATVAVENRSYVLTDIRYVGTSSSAGNRVPGAMDGTEVLYVFEEFTGYAPTVKQWIQRQENGSWQGNSEYVAANTAVTLSESKSVAVYLVLDASLSLKPDEVNAVRNASKQFIKTLYDRSREVIEHSVSSIAAETDRDSAEITGDDDFEAQTFLDRNPL
ncbi:MAG: VWA domain-containing protein [Spirochaetaceae bacterium]|jgi:hypothetical protein|nr:VWA domain-containing protein [Spirochaetaceae bacterium]